MSCTYIAVASVAFHFINLFSMREIMVVVVFLLFFFFFWGGGGGGGGVIL